MNRRPGLDRKPRLLVLSQYYRPEPNFITADVAEHLAQRADVTVITAHPNYPSGQYHQGYAYWRIERRREGAVTVWRIPHVVDRSTSLIRRALSYLSFAAGATLLAPVVAGRADVVWVYHTPFTTALAALFFRYVRRARVVFTAVDLWPESLLATGVSQSQRGINALFAFRRWIGRSADLIICLTRGMIATFAAEGIPRNRLAYLPVWVEGIPSTRSSLGAADETRIVYAGNLGPAQPVETIIRAAALLLTRAPTLRFEIYGTGSSEGVLRDLARDLGATNVVFCGRVSPAEAYAASAGALAQIVILRSMPLFRMTVPSKLFFCFAAGAPVLAGLEGEAAGLAAESQGAIPFASDDPASLARAVDQLVALPAQDRLDMRSRLRAFYDQNFDRERLLDAYEKLLLGDPAVAESEVDSAQPNTTMSSGIPVQREIYG